MNKEFYLISLNHNDNKFPNKLSKIIYKGKKYSYPFEVVGDILQDVYEDCPILGYKSEYGIRDVISKEVIVPSTNGNNPNISYFRLAKASGNDIVSITNIYKSMSNDDITRYRNEIDKIKYNSRLYYEEKQNKLKKDIIDEKIAREYLLENFI